MSPLTLEPDRKERRDKPLGQTSQRPEPETSEDVYSPQARASRLHGHFGNAAVTRSLETRRDVEAQVQEDRTPQMLGNAVAADHLASGGPLGGATESLRNGEPIETASTAPGPTETMENAGVSTEPHDGGRPLEIESEAVPSIVPISDRQTGIDRTGLSAAAREAREPSAASLQEPVGAMAQTQAPTVDQAVRADVTKPEGLATVMEDDAAQPPVDSGDAGIRDRAPTGAEPAAGAKQDGAPKTAAPLPAAAPGAAPPTAGGAPRDAQAAPTSQEAKVDTSSPGAMLESLASTPPSTSGAALNKVVAAVPDLQAREKSDLEASYPAVERPTGLPRKPKRVSRKATSLQKGPPKEASAKSGREGKPSEAKHVEPRGAIPGTQISTEVSEPAQEDSRSWWSRLFNRIKDFVSSLPTRDPGVSTSAGPRPSVDMTGDADPTQNQQKKQVSDREISKRRGNADVAVSKDFGENDVYPDVPSETLRPSYKPSGPTKGPSGAGKQAAGMAGQDREMFDQTASTWYAGEVNREQEKYRTEQETYRTESAEARADGERRIQEETERTRTEQTAIQNQARGDVDAERARWREQNRQIQSNYAAQSEAKRKEIDKKIGDKAKDAERDSAKELTTAENKAEAKRRTAESEARAEKRKAKKKKRSWWQRVKGAVSAAFKAIKQAVNAIFDALRKAVKVIIEAAKTVVRGIIELARRAIVGLIKAFGEALKVLVSVALAAFPEAAAKARAWIDRRVDDAVEVVNKAAEALKRATDAILDFVGKALDTFLAALQKVYNVILDVIHFLVIGLLEVMEKIGHLVSAARQMPDHFWGQTQEEVIGMNLSEPLPFERRAPVTSAQDAIAAQKDSGAITPQDAAVARRSQLTAEEVVVDQVAMLDEPPAFLAALNLQEGQEIVFGESADESRSLAAIQADAVGAGPPAPAMSTQSTDQEPVPPAAKLAPTTAAPAPLTPEQELQELMSQPVEGGCTKEKKGEPTKGGAIPEAAKKGPFTPSQRGRYMWRQMKKGIKQWFSCNWPWLLAAAVGALLGFIAINILTGGAALAALPLLMQIVGAIMIGVAMARVTAYVGAYIREGWQGNIAAAAKALARGLAVGAIELIFALLFNLGAVMKALKGGLKATAKAAATAAKTTVKTTAKNVRQVGKLGVQGTKAAIKNGKVVMKGIGSGVVKGAKSLDDLAKRLWERVRFKKFKIQIKNRRFSLLGYVNPWILLAGGKIEDWPVEGGASVGELVKVHGRRKLGVVIGVKTQRTTAAGKKVFFESEGVAKIRRMKGTEREAFYKRLLAMGDDTDQIRAMRRAEIVPTGTTAAHARDLRGRMAKAGKTANPGDHAHHIVPSTHAGGEEARRILDKFKIHFNDGVNGAFVPEAIHRGLHTGKYMDKVTDLLRQARSAKDVKTILAHIEKQILAGNFP